MISACGARDINREYYRAQDDQKITVVKAYKNEGYIVGENSDILTIYIRQVDDGELLWTEPFKMGTTATVPTGIRNIKVMCEISTTYGKILLPGKTEIDVKTGNTYNITGKPDNNQKNCILKIT